jgi:hypothetical protein
VQEGPGTSSSQSSIFSCTGIRLFYYANIVISPGHLVVSHELNVLGVLLAGFQKIIALVHNIIAHHAHTLGAVNITPFRVALTSTGLAGIPVLVGIAERVGLLREEAPRIVLLRSRLERQVLYVLAASVAGAVVRARGTCTTLAFISREALALTGVAVADTAVGAFGILVTITLLVRSVNPGELKRAHALRAITTI